MYKFRLETFIDFDTDNSDHHEPQQNRHAIGKHKYPGIDTPGYQSQQGKLLLVSKAENKSERGQTPKT